jgi:hypothetical protein
MDTRQHTPPPKPETPASETPVRRRGYSGRGAASALETLKKLEQAQLKREDRDPRTWL